MPGKRHILIADDEPNMLLTLQFILEVAGYQVTTAKNGQEALQKILCAQTTESPVDIIITDIQMPGLTGLELLDALEHHHLDVPVLVITGYGDDALAAELRQRGCHDFIDKPFDDQELVARITVMSSSRGKSVRCLERGG